MPKYCMRDNGWPKKQCYVMKPPKYRKPHCRHWSLGITENGCGEGMWQVEASDGGEALWGKTQATQSPVPNKLSVDGEKK
jgi:hypothetical protein